MNESAVEDIFGGEMGLGDNEEEKLEEAFNPEPEQDTL